MNKTIATIARTTEILSKYHLYPNKGYGQNFIIEPKVVEKIANNSHIDKKTAVIEIGPGIGALTEQLAIIAGHVLAFEIDRKLMDVLTETLADYPNVRIENQDFLTCDLVKYYLDLKDKYSSVVITANLPYYITTPIIFKIIESAIEVDCLTFMVQREIADRFSAKPNTKDYNALSVIIQYLYDIEQIMKISSSIFIPKPAVDSIVIQLRPKQTKKVNNKQQFFHFIKACFTQRRKTIYNNLKVDWCDTIRVLDCLSKAEIDPSRRAESLTLAEFINLYEVAYES